MHARYPSEIAAVRAAESAVTPDRRRRQRLSDAPARGIFSPDVADAVGRIAAAAALTRADIEAAP